ncbi:MULTISPECIES: hypothetical protein [Erwinia]
MFYLSNRLLHVTGFG